MGIFFSNLLHSTVKENKEHEKQVLWSLVFKQRSLMCHGVNAVLYEKRWIHCTPAQEHLADIVNVLFSLLQSLRCVPASCSPGVRSRLRATEGSMSPTSHRPGGVVWPSVLSYTATGRSSCRNAHKTIHSLFKWKSWWLSEQDGMNLFVEVVCKQSALKYKILIH